MDVQVFQLGKNRRWRLMAIAKKVVATGKQAACSGVILGPRRRLARSVHGGRPKPVTDSKGQVIAPAAHRIVIIGCKRVWNTTSPVPLRWNARSQRSQTNS